MWISNKNSLRLVPKGLINPQLFRIMAWHRRQQAIIWTNDDLVHWCIHTSLGLNELIPTSHVSKKFKLILYDISQALAKHAHILFSKYLDDLEQDCSISSALALEIPQSCTKPSICRELGVLSWVGVCVRLMKPWSLISQWATHAKISVITFDSQKWVNWRTVIG